MNAIINGNNEVIGFTSVSASQINIAGAVAVDGGPVNVKTYRISASKANRAKVCVEMPSAVAHDHASGMFYTLDA